MQQEAWFDDCLIVDKATLDLFTNVLLAHDSETFSTEFDMDTTDTLFNNLPHEVVWDGEMSCHMGMHIYLLQQLAVDSKSTDYTRARPTHVT